MSDSPTAGSAEMLQYIRALPDQLAASGDLPGLDGFQPLTQTVRQIVLCGMGGSAIAGDLARPLCENAGLPLWSQRDYGLPNWVQDDTLVVVSSYSGGTAETLSALTAAQRRGCPLFALTSGGELRERAQRPVGTGFPAVILPGGLPPRASLGFGLGALLHGLSRRLNKPDLRADIPDALSVLREGNELYDPGDSAATQPVDNPAAAVATDCLHRFLVIYSASPESHGPGGRLRAQVNENAKSPAGSYQFPELDHNDIMGWDLSPAQREYFGLLLLRSQDEDPRNSQRVSVTVDLLASEFAVVNAVHARGATSLGRIMSLVQFGDYLSWYLARERGVDPMPVHRIDLLKQQLQKGSEV
ncbi:MAG: bifunctional phosphoglucose/phosphomannose isomerase [bacterium]